MEGNWNFFLIFSSKKILKFKFFGVSVIGARLSVICRNFSEFWSAKMNIRNFEESSAIRSPGR